MPSGHDPQLEELLAHLIVAASYTATVAQQLHGAEMRHGALLPADRAAQHVAAALQLAGSVVGYALESACVASGEPVPVAA